MKAYNMQQLLTKLPKYNFDFTISHRGTKYNQTERENK